ncbi:MAG: TetR/AcrR family transcriptional regulator [Burkholderiales bacterium]|nr:TetR/AcrR family transcriptional regulator [Burkholderiales bacterium]
MASEGVRVLPATRRKPRQSRARASSEALQEAFVRVLIDKGFHGVTVREVAAVAGVGVGTFYEYVANKEALAALTIHMRVKALAQALEACIERHRGQGLLTLVSALIDEQVERVMDDAVPWSALFMLERQISTPEAYRKHYAQFVDLWSQALLASSDAPATQRVPAAARMVHSMVYGWVTQGLLTQGPDLDRLALRQEIQSAVAGYLRLLGAK